MKQNFKKFNLLLLVALFGGIMFFATSCEKDDEGSSSLIGKWQCYYNEIEGDGVYTGNDIGYPYMIIDAEYLGFSKTPNMPSASVSGEKYKYTYNDSKKQMTLVAIDRKDNLPYEEEESFNIQITKLTSNELEFEMDVNGPLEIFKYKKLQ